eukprot:gnl/MRDRNA2_/MRDRNA2_232079_c0_seq1.p1 gnl/MRDRNA2_/MRDRNA2_232079_c0~~gnl/MRDRNA2_/MRDRNA2_232079_c0_seq1.p1  ORF type:complete len:549 (-),score=105.18 gnl/MRDRNA2_/MRDRNA2_232079_c0_seq1:43-1446(-)
MAHEQQDSRAAASITGDMQLKPGLTMLANQGELGVSTASPSQQHPQITMHNGTGDLMTARVPQDELAGTASASISQQQVSRPPEDHPQQHCIPPKPLTSSGVPIPGPNEAARLMPGTYEGVIAGVSEPGGFALIENDAFQLAYGKAIHASADQMSKLNVRIGDCVSFCVEKMKVQGQEFQARDVKLVSKGNGWTPNVLPLQTQTAAAAPLFRPQPIQQVLPAQPQQQVMPTRPQQQALPTQPHQQAMPGQPQPQQHLVQQQLAQPKQQPISINFTGAVAGFPDRLQGVIKTFNSEKGFGFIACDQVRAAFGKDAFLHRDQFQNFKCGDTVSFHLRVQDGNPQAQKLQPVFGQDGQVVDNPLAREYSGRLRMWDVVKGYGFIECAATHSMFGCDVYVHKTQYDNSGIRVGELCNFTVETAGRDGKPQARNIVKAPVNPDVLPGTYGKFVTKEILQRATQSGRGSGPYT